MKKYGNLLPKASFPLGGIGTGTISLEPNGHLNDFQIFNRPSLGVKLPYTFFSLYSKIGDKTDARAIEAPFYPDFDKGRGYQPSWVAGLPRFESSEMEIRYPFATIRFKDDNLPLSVSMRAFSPFSPCDSDDSSIPGIVVHIDITNHASDKAEVLPAFSMNNIHNYIGTDVFDNTLISPNQQNLKKQENGFSGIFMTGSAVPEDALTYANNCIIIPSEGAELCRTWYRGGWYDGITDFWSHFTKGELPEDHEDDKKFSVVGPASVLIGSAASRAVLLPGETKRFTFVIAWYVPNRINGWFKNEKREKQTLRNYYAARYESAWAVGMDLSVRENELEEKSLAFSDCLYASDLSDGFINVLEENLSVLRSTTVWRDTDGTMMGWEGSHEQEGSCHGTCMHVWNYAQAVSYLFPDLEISARKNEFLTEINPNGKIPFRVQKRFGLPEWEMYPAVDGQFGAIIRAYREWKNSGDKEFLMSVWPNCQKAFDFIIEDSDADHDGLVDAKQHNTYDIEFFGPNPLTGVLELCALTALREMARDLGDVAAAQKYDAKVASVRDLIEEKCWNGEYYIQSIQDENQYPYQFGNGCLSDQLLGQTFAYICNFGDLLPQEHLKSAISAIYQHNELDGKHRDPCLQRLYIADDEKGLVLCSWPHGGKPRFPFVYSNEVWTGIEYQVITSMLCLGMRKEALQMIDDIRSRFDGIRRNPWNDMECGFYYSRSMAAWGMLNAFSGLDFHSGRGLLTVHSFTSARTLLYTWGTSYGTARCENNLLTISTRYGKSILKAIAAANNLAIKSIRMNGKEIPFTEENGTVYFDEIALSEGSELTIVL